MRSCGKTLPDPVQDFPNAFEVGIWRAIPVGKRNGVILNNCERWIAFYHGHANNRLVHPNGGDQFIVANAHPRVGPEISFQPPRMRAEQCDHHVASFQRLFNWFPKFLVVRRDVLTIDPDVIPLLLEREFDALSSLGRVPAPIALKNYRATRRPFIQGILRGHLTINRVYGVADQVRGSRRPLSRGSNRAVARTSRSSRDRINRQLSGWILPPLRIRAFGAHCQFQTHAYSKKGSSPERLHPVGVGQKARKTEHHFGLRVANDFTSEPLSETYDLLAFPRSDRE